MKTISQNCSYVNTIVNMSYINNNVPDPSSCSGENCCVGELLSGYTNCGGYYYQCMYM